MESVLSVIGAIWIVVGTVEVLYSDKFRKVVASIVNKIPPKFFAVIPLVMGVLLMISASASHSFWLVEILGILAVAKGVLLFGLPREKVRRMFNWWTEKVSEVTWRLCGLVLVILGVFLVLKI
jgi:uncharacterized protein YjeT (DUF2065 family)